MSSTAPWTVTVTPGVHPVRPPIVYVTAAHDLAEAIITVYAHHRAVTLSDTSATQILTVTADPGAPQADDARFGWTDLRGVKALRLVLEPARVRELARLRLRLRRWNTLMAPHYAEEERTGTEVPPSAWQAYNDEAEDICHELGAILLGSVRA